MGVQKHNVPEPLSNQHESYANSNNISGNRRSLYIGPPTRRIVDVTNFHYLQVVNCTNECVHQRHPHGSIQPIIHAIPNNQRFPQEPVYWRKSRLTCHEDCPPKGCSSGAKVQSTQIPNVLGAGPLYRRSIRSSHGNHNHTPNSEVNLNIDKHVRPECANISNTRSILYAQGHQELPHMSNTTISQQSFQACLCKGSKGPNNHRKNPKKSQSTSKGGSPLCLPMMSPERENCNFGQYCNPQRYTRPCTCIDVRYPEMLRSSCLFPKKSHADQPNSQQQQQGGFSSCAFPNIFNNRNLCFSSLPIKESNSQQQQTTPESTQQKVFHCCFNRVSTFRIQSTQNNQGKALLFHTLVHRHQICDLDRQALSGFPPSRTVHATFIAHGSNTHSIGSWAFIKHLPDYHILDTELPQRYQSIMKEYIKYVIYHF